jgi:hypothetical protein
MGARASFRWRKPVCAVFVLSYFVYFNWVFLRTPFAPDDMMNMGRLWRTPPFQLLLSNIALWRAGGRPMAGLFYLPIYHVWGLNPLPYHAVMLLILLANVYLTYRFAIALGATELASGLAALLLCFHYGMRLLYFDTAFIYDVLCFFFYVAAFIWYAQIRGRGRLLRGWETAVFLVLFVCALGSKQMAVTLPPMLLVYELIWNFPKQRGWKGLREWLFGPGRMVFYSGLLTLVYVWGNTHGPDAVTNVPAYKPVFTLARALDFQQRQFGTYFFVWRHTGWRAIFVVWAVMAYLAFRRRNPILIFCLALGLIGPIPIEFLEWRDGPNLAIPYAGWAIFASIVFVDLARGISGILAAEPLLRRVGRPAVFTMLIVLGIYLWARENARLKHLYVDPGLKDYAPVTAGVIQQFHALNPQVRPNTRVLFLNDPFEDWDVVFIADLWFKDRSLTIRAQRLTPFPADEIARMENVFEFQNGKLVRIR